MNDFAPPSRNPTENDSLTGLFNVVLRKFVQNSMDDMLPAQVVAYKRGANNAQVQPLIAVVTTKNVIIKRAQIMSVPVWRPGGNGVVMSFHLVAGDLGWIKANDRDISLFKQSFKQSVPNTERMHSFSDAVFIPDKMNGVTINPNHSGDAVIQTTDGSSCVALMTSNCVMDCDSTAKAFKLPVMTIEQRDAIPSPKGGMMVYIHDVHPGHAVEKFSFYTAGVGWS